MIPPASAISSAIDLTATMAIDQISRECGEPPTTVLVDFLSSKTGVQLFDDSLKLWWDGPSAAVRAYDRKR